MDKYAQYKQIRIIGKGHYGVVTRCQDLLSGDTVAIKKIHIRHPRQGVPSSVIREVSLLKELEHDNILRLLDVLSSKDSIDLVFEHLDFNLLQVMQTQPDVARSSSTIKKYLYQILHAVAYCHAHKILHRDLKPENVLIDCSNDIVKLADFGCARPIGVPSREYTTRVGTLEYMAPELLLNDSQYSAAIDVWSVACIFAEMVTHSYLFHGSNQNDQLLKIFSIMGTPDQECLPRFSSFYQHLGYTPRMNSKDLAEVVQGLEPAGVDLLNKMLCLDPSKRITAREALEHEYFKDIQNIT